MRVEVLGLAPYVDEVGWAKPGRTWAIVSVSSAVFGPVAWNDGATRVEYEGIEPGVWSVVVDGKSPSKIIDNAKGKNGRGHVIVAADVPAGGDAQLVLRTSYRSGEAKSGLDSDRPQTVGVSFTRKVQLAY